MSTTLPRRLEDAPLTHQGVRNLDEMRARALADTMPVNVGSGERVLSAVGGATLFSLGLARGGCPGLGMLWAGFALMLRGATGHCPVSAMTGRNTAR